MALETVYSRKKLLRKNIYDEHFLYIKSVEFLMKFVMLNTFTIVELFLIAIQKNTKENNSIKIYFIIDSIFYYFYFLKYMFHN